ncbi:MAG: anaerobic sulfatase-maturation protein [Bacteroidales bacterium]|nr:anaerobic sulfatase-maturation protein [Candidatus Cryptobacteroides aphodequi]
MKEKPYKDTLTLRDAGRICGPRSFSLMIKPAGSLCNLDCHYCYYLDKADIYGGKEPRMSLEMLETCVRKYIEANEVDRVCFNWHGGEPLVMGIDFYKKALEFEKKYGAGKTILNTIQTNGTLLNAEWASFFRDNGFLVGISIDGPSAIHNRYRRDKSGNPTLDRVLRGLDELNKAGVEYNTMTTINKSSEGHGLEVYDFLKSLGSHYMQFMPVVEHVVDRGARQYIVAPDTEGARKAPWSVSAIGYGRFMIDIFDYWVRHDVGRYFVNLFDSTLAGWVGAQSGTCAYAEICGGNSIIEHNGDVYCCDHFVYPEYRLGNIATDSLAELMDSPTQTAFGINKRNALPSVCLKCKWFKACHGECPKHRFSASPSGERGLNALCDGLKLFYEHVAPYMDFMKACLLKEMSPAAVMLWASNRR